MQAYLENLLRIQDGLGDLEKKCAKEQIQIQRKYDNEKSPLIDARRAVIENISGFWGKAILNHPDVKSEPEDARILDFLEDVELHDNQDDYGSHTIVLSWGERNIYFPEREIRRIVKIGSDDIETISNSPISWAPNKKPGKSSFFQFFTTDTTDESDFGEILRRDLWINPYPYFMNIPPSEFPEEKISPPEYN